MSKINAIRMINLNYNNNAIRISDETFHLNGESTLLSLRNGGGKSVLVQMMMAPFVHKRYRDAKDRPFDSYFTTAKPTFIMVEWVLDQGAGYVLTGMMVRKNQDISEDKTENLEIINFISEYRERCIQDIHHLPVVEKTKKEVRLKGFGACRQLFESYKKDSSMKFSYYDMANTAQSRQYFDRLQEYQIHYKEWETIIKKVNLKESGLSDLFSDCRDEKGLVEKWFLDAVESKLNKEKNRMREFQNIVQKYVGQYKDNKSKIERRDTIRLFKEQSVRMEDAVSCYRNAENIQADYENRIAAFLVELQKLEDDISREIEKLCLHAGEISEQIFRVEYAKISDEIHCLKKEARIVESNRDMIGLEQESLERELNKIIQKLHVFHAAKQYRQVCMRQEEWQEIQQKLEVSKKKQEELEPERNYLGFVLKCFYQNELDDHQQKIIQNQSEQEKTEEQILAENQNLTNFHSQLEKLHGDMGILQGKLQIFDEKEDAFNHRYKEQFVRNILGEYEPGMLDICRETYEKQQEQLNRDRVRYKRELENSIEQEKSTARGIEDEKRNLAELENARMLAQQKMADYEEQLSVRKNMMRYLELPEQELFEYEKILLSCHRKLEELAAEKRHLEQEEDILQKEYEKLTQGKVLELSPEFEKMLKTLGLNYVYGMEWLQKNGKSTKENRTLVKSHPFLPYALILSDSDLKKLSEHAGDVYTSFPIPIVRREQLEKTEDIDQSGVLSFSGVSFYLLFNEKLLDEEMLARLVEEKGEQIRRKKQAISVKNEEYNDYFSRKETLKKQDVTRDNYDALVHKIEDICDQIELTEQRIDDRKKLYAEIQERLETLRQLISQAQEKTGYYERRKEEFGLFCMAYEQYLENHRELEKCKKTKQKVEENRKIAENILHKKKEYLVSLEKEFYLLQNHIDKLQEEYQIYEHYCENEYEDALKHAGEFENLYKDQKVCLKQENVISMKMRYQAITRQISGERQELERNLVRAKERYDNELEELRYLERKFELHQEDYREIFYDRKEESHQEVLKEDYDRKIKVKQQMWNEENNKASILRHDMNRQISEMQKRFQKEEPLPESEILHTDFDSQLNQLQFRKGELEKQMVQMEKKQQSYQQNLTGLAEYETLQLCQDVVWEENFAEMDEKHLRDFQGMLKRDYRQSENQTKEEKTRLERLLNQVSRMEAFQDEFFRKPLETLQELVDDASLVQKQLDTITQSYDNLMQKLEVDISMVEKEKARIIELLEEYLREVHENLGKIDHNSTLTIRDRSVKMLRIKLPDWEENSNLYQIRLQDFMDDVTRKGIELFENNENAPEYFGMKITTKNLYDSVVGIGNVQIGLYKIEEYREYPIAWADVAKNSGGEGFLSAFVILSSLLYYMRKDDSDIFADRNEGKVLVMDNPFAQTNAAHLLKPLMDMAKKTNTQLICLSGLGGESIYNRFDNIYVLNLIAASLRNGMQYLKSEHLRGSEQETLIVSQVEVFEQQELIF